MQHAVSGVRVEAFTTNGSVVRSLADLNTLSNAFVRNVTFAARRGVE